MHIYSDLRIKELNIINHETRKFGKTTPHEQLFINLISRQRLTEEIFIKFIAFQEQYFPRYFWKTVNFYNPHIMVAMECDYSNYIFDQKYKYELDVSEKDLNHALEFGEIATNFCIQYLGYSLVGCGGSKSIITAQDQCDKKFDEYLSKCEEKYWLHRIPKVYYVKDKYDLFGYFKELPVLPTNNLYYGNDEYIRGNNHVFSKVLKDRKSI